MLIAIFDDMNLCTSAEVQRMLPLVSEQRREQALRFQHTFGQFACLKSYLMLMTLIGAVSPTLDYKKLTFAYTKEGKPYLADRLDLYFSISHTKNAIIVALARYPIGVDIEQFRTPSNDLLEKTMNEDERLLITAHSSDNNKEIVGVKERFTALWTRKEAVLKLRGMGIVNDLHAVISENETIETHLNIKKGYAYSIAKYAQKKSLSL